MKISIGQCFMVSHVLVYIVFIIVFFMNDISNLLLFFGIVEAGALGLSIITSIGEMKDEHSVYKRGDF